MEPNSDRRHGTLLLPQALVLLLTRLVSLVSASGSNEASPTSHTALPSFSHTGHISTSSGAFWFWDQLVSFRPRALEGEDHHYNYLLVGMGLTATCCIASGLFFKWTKSKDQKSLHISAEKHEDIFGDGK